MKYVLMILIITFIFSCKKKDTDPVTPPPTPVVDYRSKYLGDFNFTTITTSWMMGQGNTYDTNYYSGSIRLYVVGDNEKDLCSFDNAEEQNNRRISIQYTPTLLFTPEILDSGVFVEKYGYHYGHSGKYNINLDTVKFYIGGFGGLGGGTNYQIIGVRK